MDKEAQKKLNESLINACSEKDIDPNKVKLLIEQGADVNANGGTLIEIAYQKNIHVVGLLIENGADRTQIDIWEQQICDQVNLNNEIAYAVDRQEGLQSSGNSNILNVKKKLLNSRLKNVKENNSMSLLK